jgi:hypothetical protein
VVAANGFERTNTEVDAMVGILGVELQSVF